MGRQKTTWRRSRGIDGFEDADGPIWVECKVCGREKFVFASGEEAKNFICKSCTRASEEAVSMRCLRHKKRFNVPRWWLDISKWLCPDCFERLSEDERMRYAPKGDAPQTRDAEVGKPVKKPSKGKSEYASSMNVRDEVLDSTKPLPEVGDKASEEVPETQEASRVAEENIKGEDTEKAKPPKRTWEKETVRVSDNPSFAGLLPRYKIECQKCGKVVPCHYVWFDRSTVLCPSCYGAMNEFEIEEFHKAHRATKPRYEKDVRPIAISQKAILNPVVVPKCSWTRQSHLVNSGGYWSSERIMSAPKRDLIAAAKKGIVSKARMRIELRRRENASYYDLFPEEVGVTPMSSI